MSGKTKKQKKRVAIIGGGPSGLFMYKRLIQSGRTDFEISIFEKKAQLGAGMPYSTEGANDEHVTNVSDNEIPKIVTSIEEWTQTAPKEILERFNIDPGRFNEYKVLPRLLFGHYLSSQFELLQKSAELSGIITTVHLSCHATNIIDHPDLNEVWVDVDGTGTEKFDFVIISTGHNWPVKYEGTVPGYYDAPYPPSKLALKLDHPVAIRGSSLTAVDAIRTLARHNGTFRKDEAGKLSYQPAEDSTGFKLMMHSREGMLPAVRFHLEDTHLQNDSLLSEDEIAAHIAGNNGFLSLDFVFEKDFKEILRKKEPEFYQQIRDMDIEGFVTYIMKMRERLTPFELFKAEYAEAEKSIKRKQSIYWKEMLGVLSFAMNYPAKHLSAEDMQRLQRVLSPLISIVIAYIPQSSCEELLALYDAGVLDIVSVGTDSNVEAQKSGGAIYHFTDETDQPQSVYYQTYIDCVGQPHLSYEDFPFKGLLAKNTISPARLKFKSAEEGRRAAENGNKNVKADSNGDYYLKVSGITINDNFQVVDQNGAYNERIFIMAVPYIGGYNPDYSGLDFCEEASARIIKILLKTES